MARRITRSAASDGYLAELRRRAKESRIYRKYQLMGLAIAEALRDERHKSLYIKLAKERGGERLLALAKDIALRRDVRNRGAYFMSLLRGAPSPAARRLRPRPQGQHSKNPRPKASASRTHGT